ncbi:MAG: hypothetical protein ACJ768_00630 [Gaiellaceae bacterium]
MLLPVHDRGTLADPKPWWYRQRNKRLWKITPTIEELERAISLPNESAALDFLSAALTPARRVNYRTLERRSHCLNAACILLTVQLVLWLVILFVNRR